jgi:hypothetical protein
VITFIRYTQNRKIGKPKVVGGIKPKGLNTTTVERRGRLVKMDKYS